MSAEPTVEVPFWEFRYRKSMSDPGRLYIAEKFEAIPDVVKEYAVRRSIRVRERDYYMKGFDLIEYLKAIRFLP